MQEYKDKVPQNIVDAITAEVANVRALGDEASAEDVKGAVSKLQVCSLLACDLFLLCCSPCQMAVFSQAPLDWSPYCRPTG